MLNRTVSALVIGIILLGSVAVSRNVPPPPDLMPECPHSYDAESFRRGEKAGFPSNGQLSLSKAITSVPEFHDCQRLIYPLSGRLAYTRGMSAIFARAKLDSVADSQTSFDKGVMVAEVYSEADYEPLGIRTGFNCLWLHLTSYGPDKYEAQMFPVPKEALCGTLGGPPSGAMTTKLQVESLKGGKADPLDVPPVARWDWNAADSVNYIGIRCRFDWCEIHRQVDAHHPFVSSPTFTPPPGATPFEKRVVANKGWYDYQYLEEFDSQGRPVPSDVIGVVFPAPSLDTLKAPYAANKWVPAARVALYKASTRYHNKYNFSGTPPAADGSGGVRIETCLGIWSKCAPGSIPKPVCKRTGTLGFVRVTGDDGSKRYFCNMYREFKTLGFSIPGVTRWRWKVTDETVWIRCPSGCCESDPDTIM